MKAKVYDQDGRKYRGSLLVLDELIIAVADKFGAGAFHVELVQDGRRLDEYDFVTGAACFKCGVLSSRNFETDSNGRIWCAGCRAEALGAVEKGGA